MTTAWLKLEALHDGLFSDEVTVGVKHVNGTTYYFSVPRNIVCSPLRIRVKLEERFATKLAFIPSPEPAIVPVRDADIVY